MCYETEDCVQGSRERDPLTAFLLPKVLCRFYLHSTAEKGSVRNSGLLNLAQQWLSCWQSQQKREHVEQLSVHRLFGGPKRGCCRVRLKHSDKK